MQRFYFITPIQVGWNFRKGQVLAAEMRFTPVADKVLPYRLQRFAAGGPARKMQHQMLCIRSTGYFKPLAAFLANRLRSSGERQLFCRLTISLRSSGDCARLLELDACEQISQKDPARRCAKTGGAEGVKLCKMIRYEFPGPCNYRNLNSPSPVYATAKSYQALVSKA